MTNSDVKPELVKVFEKLLRESKRRKSMFPAGRAGFYCYCCNSQPMPTIDTRTQNKPEVE